MIETDFGYFHKRADVEIGTTGIADVDEFGVTRQVLQATDDIDGTDAGNNHGIGTVGQVFGD